MTIHDPWKDISVPAVDGNLSARRSDPKHPYDFYWAKDFTGNCALVLSYSNEINLKDKRPNFQEIKFSDSTPGKGKKTTGLILLAAQDKEIFFHLCKDIIESTRECTSQNAALAVLIRRTWRWHRMLKSAPEIKLGPERQKGLIGELWFLREFLLTRYTPGESMDFWLGPDGSPKDFAIGNTSVEVKARRGSARPYVSISSEHQLDDSEEDQLYLFILNVNSESEDAEDSFNLNQIVKGLKLEIERNDTGVIGQFESKLAESGYFDEHDYSDRCWVIGGFQFFKVREGFPRIAGSELPSGVADVGYKLEIKQCKDYQAEADEFVSSIAGDSE